MKVDFEFTIEFSTSALSCVGCGKVVEPGTKIMFVNGRQRDYCVDCARAYLKSLIKKLGRIEDCAYSISDNTPPRGSRRRLAYLPAAIEEMDIDSFFS